MTLAPDTPWRVYSGQRHKRRAIEEADEMLVTGTPPSPAFNNSSGLFQLAPTFGADTARVAINGGFFFDLGHLDAARELGIPLNDLPGFCYGDEVGWLVQDGSEYINACLNRCAIILDARGNTHIKRVRAEKIIVNGATYDLCWDDENTCRTKSPESLFTLSPLHGRQPASLKAPSTTR